MIPKPKIVTWLDLLDYIKEKKGSIVTIETKTDRIFVGKIVFVGSNFLSINIGDAETEEEELVIYHIPFPAIDSILETEDIP